MKKFVNEQFKFDNPFRLEEVRDKFATENLVKRFRKLYSFKYPQISNRNSGLMWDDLNFSRSEQLESSSIYKDKLSCILSFLKNKSGSLLDIGFGKGTVETQLKNSNLDLFGIDISKKSVSFLKRS